MVEDFGMLFGYMLFKLFQKTSAFQNFLFCKVFLESILTIVLCDFILDIFGVYLSIPRKLYKSQFSVWSQFVHLLYLF
jgi:hypothetical protein